ncbi:amino acid adenylation domain-containing protein [Micromonospora sp. NPDC049047]|uniref:non-ribosomal peptide synthetase n=1 Tax=Micromonospora sp. NPDC049047 TaxID=3155645 RepID=UPI0033E71183
MNGDTGEGKRKRLAALLRDRAARAKNYPLSVSQGRLWFLHELSRHDPTLNIPAAVRLVGELRVDDLERAIGRLVARHEVLRTAFVSVDGEPTQVVRPAAAFELPVVASTDVEGLAREEALRPFVLDGGSLLRARLVRVAEREHVLLLTVHHLVADGWSLGVLARELGALYDGDADLPPLSLQYGDFAVWQRQQLASGVYEPQLAYWRERLKDLARLGLTTDRPRPAVMRFRGSRRSVVVRESTATGLQALARAHGATLFMVLLAGWKAVLYRYTGQSDVVVGTPVAGRSRPELESLIGFFVSTLVLRTRVDGDVSFVDLLGRVRETALEAYAHQDVPFERLVQELAPQRDLSRNPLFDVMLTLQNTPMPAQSWKDVRLVPLDLDRGSSQFDLFMALSPRPDGGLDATLEYDSDLFDGATIERMVEHYQVLLDGVAVAPESPVADLPLMTGAERAWLAAWNDTGTPQEHETVIESFAEQVRRTPDAVAVVSADERLTYRELDDRVSRLARSLVGAGVGPGTVVGVLLPRGVPMVVTLFAVLRAGGAYLPLGPDEPQERLAFMLAEAAAPLVLTVSSLAGRVTTPTWELDDDRWRREPTAEPAPVRPGDLAYVIYTSGSTGRPKGVMIEHRALANRIRWAQRYFGLTADDVVLQKTTYTFDVSVWEFFWPLAVGARLVVAAPDAHRDPALLSDEIERHGVTTIHFVPSMLRAFVAAGQEARCRSLRRVISSGEALAWDLSQQFLATYDCELYNLYGPTEAAIDVTAWRCRSDGLPGTVPIGRPIDGMKVAIVDGAGRQVPVGVPGEALLGGVGLARGYLGRPDLTAERFVTDTVLGSGGRLYRTGDLMRLRADGELEFLGRVDEQFKLRGYRIEPGEIEAVLREHPGVDDCAVVKNGEMLVGYLAGDAGLRADDVRAYLAGRLPDHLIPAGFVRVDALPLTPSGKVDRHALPAPERLLSAGTASAPPSTPTQLILADMWRDVLDVPEVGLDDDFFAVGGHSLAAMRLLSRVNDAFQVQVDLRDFFREPHFRGLADALEESWRAGPGTADLPLTPLDSRADGIELSPAQRRLWALCQLETASTAYNIPAVVRLVGELRVDALEQALTRLVARHEVLRTSFVAVDGEPVQIVGPATPFDLTVVDSSDVQRLAREEAVRPFVLDGRSLLRARLVRVADREHVLLLTIHHLIADGWSMGVITRELAALYAGTTDLPDLPVQYGDFAVWQRRWLDGGVLEPQLAYWRERLKDLSRLELTTDRPRRAVMRFQGSRVSTAVPLQELQALARAHGATLFMVLLAGWKAVLYRYTGQSDVVVGTPVAGRSRPELESLIGFFVSTLVLRTRVDGDVSFVDLLGRVRETALEAYAHQDVPFERLVQELAPQRDLSRNPLFDVMLTLQNTPMPPLSLPGLEMQAVDIDPGLSRADLSVLATPDGDHLRLDFEYDSDLFDAATIERLATHYRTLLESVVTAPTARIADLPLMTPDEQALLAAWNDTTRPELAPHRTVDELFVEQVRRTPDAMAVDQLTYQDLNERVSRLARALAGADIGPGTVVGVMLPRDVRMVVAVLAVLRAGAAYLPLDPDYPAQRLEFMLAETGAPLVLTIGALAGRVTTNSWQLDDDRWHDRPTADPTPARPDQLAYVIFTSGSTGRPKGVMVHHRGLVASTLARADWYGAPVERFLLLSSFSFDSSAAGFYWALLTGGRLVLPPPDAGRDPHAILALIEQEQVTHLLALPSLWSAVLEAARPDHLAPLRTVITAGEALPPHLLDEQHRLRPDLHLYNEWGATEGTVFSTVYHYERRQPTVPIGRPVANARLAVVDRDGRQTPIGVPGEALVGGVALARGYIGRPDLTAERFVPDTIFGSGGRLYRTGDLMRLRADGELEFLGRVDEQVKLRGYRIEPGEIEAVLAGHPAVRDCAVVLRDGTLVAYVAADDTEAPDIRTHLSAHLPDYMVPGAFAFLDALPLTPNGKVDRAALPEPQAQDSGDDTYTAPRTDRERTLATVWQDVLGVDRIGVHDDFFALGGDSIVGIRVVARAARAGIRLSPADLFERPTIAALAEASSAPAPAGPAEATGESYPLTPTQHGMLVHTLLAPSASLYTPQLAATLDGDLDAAALRRAWQAVLARHPALRSVVDWAEAGEPRQTVRPTVDLDWQEQDWRDVPEPEHAGRTERLLHADRARGLDLAQAPPMRVTLVRLGERRWLFVWLFHHALIDGWSVPLILRDVASAYLAARDGEPVTLPPAPAFRDYVAWLRARDPQAGEAFWRDLLAGFAGPTPLVLPGDPRGAAVPTDPPTESDLDECVLELPDELVDAVAGLARAARCTVSTVFQAAWGLLLGRYAGLADVVFAAASSGRSAAQPGTEETVGLFLNTVPVRVRLDGAATVRQWLADLQAQQGGARQHEHVPLVRIRELAGIAAHTSVADSLLVFNNATLPTADLRRIGVTVSDVRSFSRTSFPLAVAVFQEEHVSLGVRFDTRRFGRRAAGAALLELAGVLRELTRSDEGATVGDLTLAGAQSADPLAPLRQPLRRERQEPVTARVAAVARDNPAAVAVTLGERSWSYGELVVTADRIARRLLAGGLRPGDHVLVTGPSCFGLIAAMLGVLRARGVLVPLDPRLPERRKRDLAATAGAHRAVLVGGEAAAAGDVIEVAEDGSVAPVGLGPSAPAEEVTLADPTDTDVAYAVFTSGSTGAPRLVRVAHAGLAHFLSWQRDTFAVGPTDRCAQLTALSFDVILRDVFLPLVSGATLCIPRPEDRAVDRVLSWLAAQRVTVLHAVPSLAHAWLAAGSGPATTAGPELRVTFFAGEPLTSTLVDAWRARTGRAAEVVNLYGPAETCLATCWWRVPERPDAGVQPIGSALAGRQAFVLGPNDCPCGVGELGEIAIRNPYHGEVTEPDGPRGAAGRFLPNPATGDPADLIYRTGDAGRLRPDGTLEISGRLDEQVKIRGVRVNPAEVNAALLGHPAVAASFVSVRRDDAGGACLVAYVVPAGGSGVSATELRTHVASWLPTALVPAAFVPLDRLPLLPNGKVDRAALPSPEPTRAALRRPPENDRQVALAAVWRDVTGVTDIGLDDDFFALGGHSLSATQVVSRVRAVFGVELPIVAIFEHPTLQALTEAIGTAPRADADDDEPIVRVSRAERRRPQR